MRKRARYLAIALLLVTACGGGSSKPSPSGGAGGSSGSGGAGGAGDPCANLACLQHVQDLMLGCEASGACVSQAGSSELLVTASCYDNGLKILSTQVGSQTSTVFTDHQTYQVKNGGGLCYTRTFDLVVGGDGGTGYSNDSTMQDASGTLLVTTHMDVNNVTTVTCPGGQPTVFTDGSCGIMALTVSSTYLLDSTTQSTCTDGTCTF
jgi:hypothetical protein